MPIFSSTAKLDSTERRMIREIIASINVGLPVDDTLSEREQRHDEVHQLRRSLGALAGGDHCGPATFERAAKALEKQIEACERESDVGHWLADLTAEQRAVPTDDPTGPTRMCAVLAEGRAVQLRVAREALDMVLEISGQLASIGLDLVSSDDD